MPLIVDDSSIKAAQWIGNMDAGKPNMGWDLTTTYVSHDTVHEQCIFHQQIWIFSISLERLKIENTYLVGIINTTSIFHWMTNYPIKWAWPGSRDLILKYGTWNITSALQIWHTNRLCWALSLQMKSLPLSDPFEIFGPPLYLWNG